MTYHYGTYAGWTAHDLLNGKGGIPSPFPDGVVPPDWDWQNFLNYGGDGQARSLIESWTVLKKPEPEKIAPLEKPKAPKKAKAKLPSWSETKKKKAPAKKPVAKKKAKK